MRPKGSEKTPGSGRQKGALNKENKALRDMILQALDEAGGVNYLKTQAENNPGPFLTLIGKVLPTTLTADGAGEGELIYRWKSNAGN